MSSTAAPPFSSSPSSSRDFASTHKLFALPGFWHLLFHQVRQEARLMLLPWLGWFVVLAVQVWHAQRPQPDEWLSLIITFLKLSGACWLVFLSIRADAPVDTNTAVRSRPVGDALVWMAKVAAFFSFIMIPLLLADLTTISGFGLSLASWLAAILGNLLFSGLVLSATAALLSLAATPRQMGVLLLLSGLGTIMWAILVQPWFQQPLTPPNNIPDTQHLCGGIVSAGVAFLLTFTSWQISAVGRRRSLATVLVLAAMVQQPLTQNLWNVDWMVPTPPRYPDDTTHLDATTPTATAWTPQQNFQTLSPGLVLHGLREGEVASIVALAPDSDSKSNLDWPPPSHPHLSAFELGAVDPYHDSWDSLRWVRLDHLRAVARTIPEDQLWSEMSNISDSLNFTDTIHRKKVFTEAALKADHPWRMRLAIHRMRKVAELPLRDLHAGRSTDFVISPGVKLELDSPVRPHWMLELHGRIRHLQPTLRTSLLAGPLRVNGYRIPDNLLLVTHDPVTLENGATASVAIPQSYSSSSIWKRRESFSYEFYLPEPKERFVLTGLEEQSWRDRVMIQIWLPEYRGTVDHILTAEQMRQLLPDKK